MKKRILLTLLLAFSLVLLLTLVVSAEENVPEVTDRYYLVQSLESEVALDLIAKGENVVAIGDLFGTTSAESAFIAGYADGSHIELTLAENIVTTYGDNVCILLKHNITVTMIYNGFIHAIPNNGRINGFYLANPSAKLRMIGSNGAHNDQGVLDTTFTNPTISNGAVTERGNLDVYHSGKVYAWVLDRSVYAENLRGFAGEEVVYSETGSNVTVTDNYEFVNIAAKSNSVAIGLQGQANGKKIVKVTDCYFATKCQFFTIATGTVFTNTIFNGDFEFDCWDLENNLALVENCTISSMTNKSGRTHFLFKDCTFKGSKPNPGSDGGGAQHLCFYTSENCENSSSMTFSVNGAGTFDSYEAYSAYGSNKLANVFTDVSIVPAKGHDSGEGESIGIFYTGANGFFDNGSARYVCVACEKEFDKENALAPIFVALGITHTEDQSNYAVMQSFRVNQDALKEYNLLGNNVITGYGLVVGTQLALGEGAEIFENGTLKEGTKAGIIDFSSLDTKYDVISMKVAGLEGTSEKHGAFADLALYCGAYILVNGQEGVESSYASLNASKALVVTDTLQTTFTYNLVK